MKIELQVFLNFINIIEKTTIRAVQKFQTGFLWIKKDDVIFLEHRLKVLKRLCIYRKKNGQRPYVGQLYCPNMDNFEQKGYIRKLIHDKIDIITGKIWYLLHLGIIRLTKRIVFDVVAKSNSV